VGLQGERINFHRAPFGKRAGAVFRKACPVGFLADGWNDGAIRVPDGPGLGVKLNREKLREYHELYRRLGGYPYDQDPGRPGWTPIVPNDRWADPKDDRPVNIPY